MAREAADDCPEETAGSTYPRVPVLLPKHLPLLGFHGRPKSGFHQSLSICLEYIQEALFQNQWQRAAEFMLIYFQILGDTTTREQQAAPEIFWRLGTEILFHHPKSSIEVFNCFADRMKNIGVKHFLQVSLEHAFHLLCQGMMEDAHRVLTVAESWRYGTKSAAQEKVMKLIQTYRVLLDHHTWLEKRAAAENDDQDYFAESSSSLDTHSHFQQAKIALHEIIQLPGVWDPFVRSYVDLLEYYSHHDEAEELLRTYAYDSKYPSNPNAHVYLYKFLKKNHKTSENLIQVLKVLYNLVPSHELMLEFAELLQQSNKEEHHKLALQVIFSVLDFSGWRKNKKAWNCLAKQMKQAIKCRHRDWVQEEWKSRKDWWPAFHFSHFLARKDWQKSEKLACCKYFTYVVHQGPKAQKKKLKTVKKLVKKHSFVKPR
ncbi:TATA box-binding protein-associated factor RNA polymerase I subunit A isoform X2 [Microcaecilia unicolor]|uniref:TATA box-binding protein-associated factor RNA polymerase I subunit A isoform X2 n=1 Tax=Microcaecilia unicolor TaxID=1415580 RepID=A0A6P7XMF8_9AMPH|nr:TATA box-binding protein-associated factor RNA polymerase I subunit A isoform X2 [Microcaecilia unicolor]